MIARKWERGERKIKSEKGQINYAVFPKIQIPLKGNVSTLLQRRLPLWPAKKTNGTWVFTYISITHAHTHTCTPTCPILKVELVVFTTSILSLEDSACQEGLLLLLPLWPKMYQSFQMGVQQAIMGVPIVPALWQNRAGPSTKMRLAHTPGRAKGWAVNPLHGGLTCSLGIRGFLSPSQGCKFPSPGDIHMTPLPPPLLVSEPCLICPPPPFPEIVDCKESAHSQDKRW